MSQSRSNPYKIAAFAFGQLAIIPTFLGVTYLTHRSWFYPKPVLIRGLLGIAIALVWLIKQT